MGHREPASKTDVIKYRHLWSSWLPAGLLWAGQLPRSPCGTDWRKLCGVDLPPPPPSPAPPISLSVSWLGVRTVH